MTRSLSVTSWHGRPARALSSAFNLRKSALICGSLLFLSALTRADSTSKSITFEEGHTPKPYFSLPLEEGNYTLTLTLGSDTADSVTTVKAEARRLMLENIPVPKGQSVTKTITVNLRRHDIAGGSRVAIRGRESTDWDDKLTLEFSGANPAVRSLTIAPAPESTPTIYIAGDSTVCDQPKEPYNSWGQMLPRFFNPGIAISNQAESGRALRSFEKENRLKKILSTIKKGDYLLIQFGHNDQKEKGEGVGAFTTYKTDLKHYVAEVKAKGATPIVITPVARRRFNPDGTVPNSLGDYPEAVRQTATEENIPLIDLNADATILYQTLGEKPSIQLFAPGDNTHHNNYGSYEIAQIVATNLRHLNLPLSSFITEDLKDFDPHHPDAIENVHVPPSPLDSATTKPEGN